MSEAHWLVTGGQPPSDWPDGALSDCMVGMALAFYCNAAGLLDDHDALIAIASFDYQMSEAIGLDDSMRLLQAAMGSAAEAVQQHRELPVSQGQQVLGRLESLQAQLPDGLSEAVQGADCTIFQGVLAMVRRLIQA